MGTLMGDKSGYVFLHILSAEGRHHPMPGVTGEEYEASRQAIVEKLRARRGAVLNEWCKRCGYGTYPGGFCPCNAPEPNGD